MRVEVSVPDRSELLSAVRGLVSAADEALLCVAFANQAGVRLLEGQLRTLGDGGRLLATTVFGSTTTAALHDAAGFGTQVRVYNHASGTYHPKLYLARHGARTHALVGSANLTSGLLRNVAVAALLEGRSSAPPLAALWERAETLWTDDVSRAWEPAREPAVGDIVADDLWALLLAAVSPGTTARTVSDGKLNRITEVTRHGLWVETDRTEERGTGAQHVPAWMFNTAWDYLVARGRLANTTLLHELNVHRSSLVCAVLALLPPVTVESRHPIVLGYDSGAAVAWAAEDPGSVRPRGEPVSHPAEEAADPVVFAERLLALLDSGRFTMSYKYAVLLALVDACLEGLTATGEPPQELRARTVADKLLELYWRQAKPYPVEGETRVLRQRPELRKLDLVARVAAFRQAVGFDRTMAEAHTADFAGFQALREQIFATIVRMPLPKLQRMNRDDPFGEGFLYRIGWPNEVSESRVRRHGFDDRIHLEPGVGAMLVRLAGLVRPIVQRRWAEFVARRNADILDDLTLDEFLFGAERVGLHRVRAPLVELQRGACFYCGDHVMGRVDIDHFLPWSRSGDDGIDNLVATHARCNNAKRASLAADEHLDRWLRRSEQDHRDLQAIAEDVPWPRHVDKTMAVARALYLYQAPGTGLWAAPDTYRTAGRETLQALLVEDTAAARAAEHRPPYASS